MLLDRPNKRLETSLDGRVFGWIVPVALGGKLDDVSGHLGRREVVYEDPAHDEVTPGACDSVFSIARGVSRAELKGEALAHDANSIDGVDVIDREDCAGADHEKGAFAVGCYAIGEHDLERSRGAKQSRRGNPPVTEAAPKIYRVRPSATKMMRISELRASVHFRSTYIDHHNCLSIAMFSRGYVTKYVTAQPRSRRALGRLRASALWLLDPRARRSSGIFRRRRF